VCPFDDDVACTGRLLIMGYEHVDAAVECRSAPYSVPVGGLETCEDGVGARVEQARDYKLVRRGLSAAQQDGGGQQQLPGAAGATSGIHRRLGHS